MLISNLKKKKHPQIFFNFVFKNITNEHHQVQAAVVFNERVLDITSRKALMRMLIVVDFSSYE